MRPIDMILDDAEKAASAGVNHLTISRAELRLLKDYELVVGTGNKDVANFIVDNTRPRVPLDFQLLVTEDAT